jgi:pentatricopeptide repeat protein
MIYISDIEKEVFEMAGKIAGSLCRAGLINEAEEFTNKMIERQDDYKAVMELCMEYNKIINKRKDD